MKKFSQILWGLAFIALGIILILNVTQVTDIDLFFDGWWTLFIIVPNRKRPIGKPFWLRRWRLPSFGGSRYYNLRHGLETCSSCSIYSDWNKNNIGLP